MADNDIFERALPPSFRKAYRVAKGDGSSFEVAQQCRPALANFLRQNHGCPAFEDFLELINPVFISPADQIYLKAIFAGASYVCYELTWQKD